MKKPWYISEGEKFTAIEKRMGYEDVPDYDNRPIIGFIIVSLLIVAVDYYFL